MPVDPKEALSVLGYDPDAFETVDDFKADVETRWVPFAEAHMNKDVQNKVFGKLNNAMRTKLKQQAKGFEVDLNFDEMDATEGIEALGKTIHSKMAELKAAQAAGGKGSKEAEEIKRQYEELQKKYQDTESLYKTAVTKYEELDNSIKTEKMQAKIDSLYAKAEEGVKWKEGMSKYELEGFRAHIRKNYPVRFDDEGNEYVTDANGNRIKDPKKAAAFLDLSTVIKLEAEKEKLVGGAPQGNAPIRRTMPIGTPQTPAPPAPQVGGRPTRQVMPRQ